MIDVRRNWQYVVYSLLSMMLGYNIIVKTREIVENEYWAWLNGLGLYFIIIGIVNGVLAFQNKGEVK